MEDGCHKSINTSSNTEPQSNHLIPTLKHNHPAELMVEDTIFLDTKEEVYMETVLLSVLWLLVDLSQSQSMLETNTGRTMQEESWTDVETVISTMELPSLEYTKITLKTTGKWRTLGEQDGDRTDIFVCHEKLTRGTSALFVPTVTTLNYDINRVLVTTFQQRINLNFLYLRWPHWLILNFES